MLAYFSMVVAIAALFISGASLWLTIERDHEQRHLAYISRKAEILVSLIKQQDFLNTIARELNDAKEQCLPAFRERFNAIAATTQETATQIQGMIDQLTRVDFTARRPNYELRVTLEDLFGKCQVVLEHVARILQENQAIIAEPRKLSKAKPERAS